MATKLLLLKDVDALGRSGEVVSVRPGFARNYLIPQGLAVIADNKSLRLQERLQEERQKRALEDKQEAEKLAHQLGEISITTVVKVDHEGHMYGSVTAADIVHLLQEQHNLELDKRNVQIKHPIKATGVHAIPVKLKEGVTSTFHLKVMTEEGFKAAQEEQQA